MNYLICSDCNIVFDEYMLKNKCICPISTCAGTLKEIPESVGKEEKDD